MLAQCDIVPTGTPLSRLEEREIGHNPSPLTDQEIMTKRDGIY